MKKLIALLALAIAAAAATIENGSHWSAGGRLRDVEIEFREVAGSNPVKYEVRAVVWDEDDSQAGEWSQPATVEDGVLVWCGTFWGPNGTEFHARRGHPSHIRVNPAGQRLSYRMKKHAPKPGGTL